MEKDGRGSEGSNQREEKVKSVCLNCGKGSESLAEKHVYVIKRKSQWESIDKQVRDALIFGRPILLSFTNEGLKLGMVIKDVSRDPEGHSH